MYFVWTKRGCRLPWFMRREVCVCVCLLRTMILFNHSDDDASVRIFMGKYIYFSVHEMKFLHII